jgi:predicted O-linked N-acetylglucosamine transferase (SPINDLY family)
MATLSEAFRIALAHHRAGRLEAAAAIYRRILQADPRQADTLHLLGVIAQQVNQPEAAIEHITRAIALRPSAAEYHNNLGAAYRALGQLDEVEACCRRAIALRPDYVDAHNNLGIALKDQGRLDEALACYRRALRIQPDDPEVHSNLVYTLSFCTADPRAVLEEARCWNQRHAAPLAHGLEPHANDRSPERRLRVGYVSPDLRQHPVGRFLLPLLEAHDHQQFEVFCYSSARPPDAITDRCRQASDAWREAHGLADAELAQCVRQDRIDILVDLTMHMLHNRLLVFARRPAPVQVTYLAYCGTTGLDAIDYRLTDPRLDPPGEDRKCYTEQSWHLPDTYWCYRPADEAPTTLESPAPAPGTLTFGCLNNFCKLSSATLAAWTSLLQTVPRATLLVHAREGTHRQRLRAVLAQHDVASERVTFVGLVPVAEYFRLYHGIDVALDPFPYGGGTTTCDALWMGVPVVSLAGRTAVGRGGLSILSGLGLAELVATDEQQYVDIASRWARDASRRAELRATLRQRMQRSPLMDAPRFARNVETAYRGMWHRWCRSD